MEEPFDELSKILAEGVSRREVFERAGGLLLGAVLASLGLRRLAWADGTDCNQVCNKEAIRQACLDNTCIGLTGARLTACLALCIPLRRRNCFNDCETCAADCTGSNSVEDPDCFSDCFGGCRDACRAAFYPSGKRRNECIDVCARCIKSEGLFCADGRRGPAHCCNAPAQVCLGGKCTSGRCGKGTRPCVNVKQGKIKEWRFHPKVCKRDQAASLGCSSSGLTRRPFS
jgi:hypothetical protein